MNRQQRRQAARRELREVIATMNNETRNTGKNRAEWRHPS